MATVNSGSPRRETLSVPKSPVSIASTGVERRSTSAASSGPLRSALSKPATTRPSNTNVGTPGGQIPALRECRTRSSRAAASPSIER